MNIFLTGARGFIGAHLAESLHCAGHHVRGCVRRQNDSAPFEQIAIDFKHATSAADWLPLLKNVDVVINAVGIFSERGDATFSVIHDQAPRALFSACAQAGVPCVIQLSALGAALDAGTEFLRSKARADTFLQQQSLDWLILQPSLVFGEGGQSAELFITLAALPVIVLPDGGIQRIQPVHIDDISTAILRFIDKSPGCGRDTVAAVGPEDVTVKAYINSLRAALGKKPNWVIGIPTHRLAIAGRWLPVPWLQPEALRMLNEGSRANAAAFALLLDRQPRAIAQFVKEISTIHTAQQTAFAIQWLRLSLALLWIMTGIISLGVFPVQESVALLQRVGIAAELQLPLLYAAALLDIALGIVIIFIRRAWLWTLQGIVIVFYSLVIAWKLPEFWLHPFAPLLKNIPLLAAIYLLYCWDRLRGNHRVPAR